MLTKGPGDSSLYPHSPKSLKSQWLLYIPQLVDPIEFVEIDSNFLLSLGAHCPHQNYLFATKRKPTLNEILVIESAVSFCFDCPCAFMEPRFPKESTQLYRGYRAYHKKFHGPTIEGWESPFRGQTEVVDIASQNALDTFPRCIDTITPGKVRWHMKLPKQPSVRNAMIVYRHAALSLDPFSRILNYWRCLESITTIEERKKLFANILNLTPSPLFALNTHDGCRRFNVMKKYKNESRLHFNRLVKTLGTPSALSDHFYKQRRCPIAHANGKPLSYESGVSYGEFARDCIMLKLIVRCAIEAKIESG